MVRATQLFAFAFFAALFVAPTSQALAKEESKSKAVFENTGIEPDASGQLKMKFQTDAAKLDVKLRNLTANAEYSLRADGIDQLFFDTDDDGGAELVLHAPGDGEDLLTFDPRNRRLSIHDGDDDVLEVDLSDPSSVEKLRIKERSELEPTELAQGGEAEVRLKRLPNGREEFVVKTKHARSGTYDVYVDGVQEGSFDVNSGGSGKIIFKSGKSGHGGPGGPPKDNPGQAKKHRKKVNLEFDPFAKTVELKCNDQVHFTGDTLADIPGFNECDPDDLATDLDATNGGSADAALNVADDCKLVFTVSIDGVVADDYDVFVGGVWVGSIVAEGDPASGSLTAETRPDSNDDVPLGVDPRGKRVEVFRGADLVFEADFPE